MRIRTFQGLRPTPEHADDVASLPYDVVNREEAAALAAGNPLSFLRVVRAEIDLPEDTNPYAPEVYAKAKENLLKLEHDCHLVRETEPSLYFYRQQMGQHKQTGLVAVCHIGDYENNIIKKHEKTRQAKEDDRTNLNRALRAHPGPVFLTHKDSKEVQVLTDDAVAGTPLIDFTAVDGVRHTIWKVSGDLAQDLVGAFHHVPVAYVADGHHRSASAARVGKELREANPDHSGEEDYNWFLAVLFPAGELNILPYNRLIKDLNGMTAEGFLAKLREVAEVAEDAPNSPLVPGSMSLYLEGKWFGLTFPQDPDAGPIERLDAYVLQDKVLTPMLAIDDPRTSDRIDFVGGIRGTAELEKRVNSGDWAAAVSMYPVTIQQLMDIADAGEIMPPKSTWFEPKLRSGLFVHTF